MADTKISDMTPATDVALADLIPIVKAGVNEKATKTQMFTAGIGEFLGLMADGVNNVGLVTPTSADSVLVGNATGVILRGDHGFQASDGAFTWKIRFDANLPCSLDSGGGMMSSLTVKDGAAASMLLTGSAGTVVFVCAAGMVCPYIDGTGGAWTVPAPLHYNVAIDRLAVALRASGWGGVL